MNEEPRNVLCTGRFLRLIRIGRWEYAERVGVTGGVVIVALTDERRVILLEQFRVPLGRPIIELPAGLAGDSPIHAAEALADAARRELREEAGYEADQMSLLTSGPPSPGMSSEVLTFFRATGLRRVSAGGGDGHERIQVHEIPLAEVGRWLTDRQVAGRLVDPKVYAGLYFLSV